MRVSDYRKILSFSAGDRLLVDGPKGTRSIDPIDAFGQFKIVAMPKSEYDTLPEKNSNVVYLVTTL